MNHCVV